MVTSQTLKIALTTDKKTSTALLILHFSTRTLILVSGRLPYQRTVHDLLSRSQDWHRLGSHQVGALAEHVVYNRRFEADPSRLHPRDLANASDPVCASLPTTLPDVALLFVVGGNVFTAQPLG